MTKEEKLQKLKTFSTEELEELIATAKNEIAEADKLKANGKTEKTILKSAYGMYQVHTIKLDEIYAKANEVLEMATNELNKRKEY